MTPARDLNATRLALDVADHLLKNGFADEVADAVSARVSTDFAYLTSQGWHMEHLHPARSSYCFEGEHHACDGTAPPSEQGCHCPCHRGEPIPEYGYRLRIDDNGRLRAEPRDRPREEAR